MHSDLNFQEEGNRGNRRRKIVPDFTCGIPLRMSIRIKVMPLKNLNSVLIMLKNLEFDVLKEIG